MRPSPDPAFPVLLAYRCQYGGRNDFYTRQMPVGLGTINAVLRASGFDARLANFSRSTWREVRAKLHEFRPRVLGISLFTFNRGAALRLAKEARRVDPGVFVVVGGPHATHLAEFVMERNSAVDAVVLGEGEETMLELVRAIQSGATLTPIAGLVLRTPGGLLRTPSRPPVGDLDGLPHPSAHYESFGVDRMAQFEFLITSRGCPARCTFCSTPEFWGTRLRFRSVDHVLDELRLLQERFGLVTVSFRDDTFTVDKRRTIDLCRGIIDSGLHLLWDCQSRVNAVDEERLLWMRRAGCQHIQYGVESGSREILRRLNKGIRLDQVVEACDLTRKIGMELSIYLITGVPEETPRDIAATLGLIRRIRPQEGIVSPLVVYPGTALYEEAKRFRGVDDSVWERSRMEGLLVRDDAGSIRAYRRVDAALRRAGARNGYRWKELEDHKRVVGRFIAPYLTSGEAFELRGQLARAAADYAQVLDIRPGSLWGHLRLGNLQERQGDFSVAAEHYRAAANAVPRYHLTHALLGSAYRRMGRVEDAEREYRFALELYPKDRVARSGLTLLHRPDLNRTPRAPLRRSRPSSALTASPTWPSFLHPIPDGQPFRDAKRG